MATSTPLSFTIADVLDWHSKHQLDLNPFFQRRPVWLDSAKVYLIDTILLGLPIPKFYLRSSIDLETKRQVREIVDGQQRLRAIIQFSEDDLVLSSRSRRFSGRKYSDLDDESKQAFLSYGLAGDQLINASDEDILEIFARLNAYTVTLNPPETRHAQFQGNFKWSIYDKSKQWSVLWDKYGILSKRDRLRMLDDSFIAELYGILLQGVEDGGQPRITRLYAKFDEKQPLTEEDLATLEAKFDQIIEFLLSQFGDILEARTPISNSPHFLLLFAAIAHYLVGIPAGDLGSEFPERPKGLELVISDSRKSLIKLGEILSSEEPPSDFHDFWINSKTTTQRIASRRVRFPYYWNSLKFRRT